MSKKIFSTISLALLASSTLLADTIPYTKVDIGIAQQNFKAGAAKQNQSFSTLQGDIGVVYNQMLKGKVILGMNLNSSTLYPNAYPAPSPSLNKWNTKTMDWMINFIWAL